MHLKNRPTYFTKNGIRKPVYYTVDARQLVENGWIEEGSSVAPEPIEVVSISAPVAAPEPVEPEEEIAAPLATEVNLDDMTRAELVQFAEANDVEFKSYATKSEILEACKESLNG